LVALLGADSLFLLRLQVLLPPYGLLLAAQVAVPPFQHERLLVQPPGPKMCLSGAHFFHLSTQMRLRRWGGQASIPSGICNAHRHSCHKRAGSIAYHVCNCSKFSPAKLNIFESPAWPFPDQSRNRYNSTPPSPMRSWRQYASAASLKMRWLLIQLLFRRSRKMFDPVGPSSED